MRLTLISVLIIMSVETIAQTTGNEYSNWVKRADSLYKSADYKGSVIAYTKAFKSFGWKGYVTDRYNAACSWARASVADSAFSNLDRIVTKANYSNYDHMINDKDLESLHNDPRWTTLIERARRNKDKEEATFNKKLIRALDSMVSEDQKWRHRLTAFDNGETKDENLTRNSIANSMNSTDSLNYFFLEDVVRVYGFPNFDLVGQTGSHNFWLLIQHQDRNPRFQEEVLNKMKLEVDKGKAFPADYAYLVDRVKVNTGQLQVYGTQMQLNASGTSYEPKPVIEPDKLNERRKSVGLFSIEEYTDVMNKRYFGTLKKK